MKTTRTLLIAIAAAALLSLSTAEAATVTVTGTNPTTNVDTSTIPATGEGSLTNLRIEYGTCSAPGVFGVRAGDVPRIAGAPGSNFSQVLNLQPGTSCVRAFVSNTYGVESIAGNVVAKVVNPPTPNPPVLAAIAPTVYDVRPNESTFAFERGQRVGSVKLGAQCDEARTTGDDYYALERPSRVVLTKTPRSTALVARCG